MGRSRAWIPLALAFFVLLVPLVASAQGIAQVCDGIECNACHVVDLIQNIINFVLGLSIPIAVGLVSWAGILYFTSAANPGNITKARAIFRSAIIGFIVALSAFLVVETILHAILDEDYFPQGWNQVTCPDKGPTNATLGDLFQEVRGLNPQQGQAGSIPGGGLGTGVGTQIVTLGPDGTALSIGFPTSRSEADLLTSYNNALANYGTQIDTACNTPEGRAIPNCRTKVATIIALETGGNRYEGCNEHGACGPMQVKQANAIGGCNVSTSACSINSGVRYLSRNYTTFGQSFANAAAAYNSGNSTVPGQSPQGLNSAMVRSSNNQEIGCGSSYYAWQCYKNPGGLKETQDYVANACSLLRKRGDTC